MQHDLPQVLTAKDQVVKAYNQREQVWKDIYDAIYSLATCFANKSDEKQFEVNEQ